MSLVCKELDHREDVARFVIIDHYICLCALIPFTCRSWPIQILLWLTQISFNFEFGCHAFTWTAQSPLVENEKNPERPKVKGKTGHNYPITHLKKNRVLWVVQLVAAPVTGLVLTRMASERRGHFFSKHVGGACSACGLFGDWKIARCFFLGDR